MSRAQISVRRWFAGLLAVAVVAAGLIVVEPSPRAAQAAACTGTSGVTVVVDYGPLGGGVQVACALGDPATGLAALQGAGFTVTGTQRWGLAFVCRINGQPTAASDPCINTPPASAYWSYWHASGSGAAWSYSTLGAGSYNPAPGTVEGWSFGSGAAPGITAP
ncbi:hypothetical protein SAMN05443287_102478 [Micromonospora phaseoli]|uniref:Flagellar hook-length control protein FliK n=2 Tax=Micromonospora phaseoli TaxID=1144548 RepID=A0A1H6VBN5_9ACTN|nr:hypothetical protein [Micromonospora phaseoli]PZV93768.1 hypothetical protein CLV64_109229 [Micromonospora phaseoli]GIJ79956.1 hypothetical protein Xph01_43880 [Micromonospora phaseoli]SEI98040.1 hypothetical protein SAMN05443287_102478 [Micromonospora phaseoli]